MTLAEGLEAKELREALESLLPAQNSIISWSRGGGKTTVLKAFDKLNIPKSSYEQEAELMEAVISAAQGCEIGGSLQLLSEALHNLDNFRAERRTS